MTSAHVIHAPAGTITVAPSVLEHVVQRAAEQAGGVRVTRPRRGLDVDVESDRAHVTVAVCVRYGEVLPDVAADVQRRVAAAIRETCGLDASAVDVSIEELE